MTPTLLEIRAAWLDHGVEVLALPAATVAKLGEPTRSWLCGGTLPLDLGPGLPRFRDVPSFLAPLTAGSWGPSVPDGLERWRIVGLLDRDPVVVHERLGSVAVVPEDFVPVPISTSVPVLAACLLERHRGRPELAERIRELEPDPRCRSWWKVPEVTDPPPAGLAEARLLVDRDDRLAAATLLYELLERDERNVEAYRLLVTLHLRSDEPDRARAVLLQAGLVLDRDTVGALEAELLG